MADAGEVLFEPIGLGKFGREFLGTAQLLFLIFVMGSHLLTFTVMMDTLTDHGTCSIVFGIVGPIVSFIFALPRTLLKVSWLSIACMCLSSTRFSNYLHLQRSVRQYHRCATGHYDRYRDSAPGKRQDRGDDNDQSLISVLGRNQHCICIWWVLIHPREKGMQLINLQAGHVAFFGFISEMETPTDYPKTLYLLQITDTSMYAVAAIVIYIYGGKGVHSPALSSTKLITAKVAYGIAIPTVSCFDQRTGLSKRSLMK